MAGISAAYITHMGDDRHIINAARVSFAQDDFENHEIRTDAQVLGLLNFLARGMQSDVWSDTLDQLIDGTMDITKAMKLLKRIRHTPTHWVPFAHTAITVKCSAPVPIRTQCFKHKQGLVESEESRRYIKTTPEYFMPDFFREKAADVKQGSTSTPAQLKKSVYVPVYEDGQDRAGFAITKDPMEVYKIQCETAIKIYEKFIEDGVCPEQARFVLPQGAIVNWVWTGNLYAFANFYLARSDSHAQKEVQCMAQEIDAIIRPLYPKAWAALVDQ